MQNLDPTGEYSDAEVKEALSGASGSSDWAFRYEHLDQNNNFIEEVDYVQSCTIDNNSLADIKRTAKFHILDTGTINYLRDRIKPYARLNMPKKVSGGTYAELLSSLKPTVWWKMDDPTSTYVSNSATVNVADGLTNNSVSAAYTASKDSAVMAYVNPVQGTNRAEFWVRLDTTNSNPIVLQSNYSGSTSTTDTIKVEVYFSSGAATTIAEMQLLMSFTDTGDTSMQERTIAFPRVGTYYVRAYNPTTRGSFNLTIDSAGRAFDSSGNGNHGAANNGFTSGSSIVLDGGKSFTSTGQLRFSTDSVATFGVPDTDGISISQWVKFGTSGQYTLYSSSLTSDGSSVGNYSSNFMYTSMTGNVMKIQYYYFDQIQGKTYNSTFTSSALPADGKTHHVVTSVTPDGFFFYLDGKPVSGTVVDSGTLTGKPTSFKVRWAQLSTSNYKDGNDTQWDDYSLFLNGGLTAAQVTSLYLKGLTPVDTRKGYVEWPQGVFLLSSPKRTMVEGNEVTREVEAYDQLLVLKEDSYDARVTFDAGVSYTDAIAAVVASTKASAKYPITTPDWKGATFPTDSSIKFVGMNSVNYTATVKGAQVNKLLSSGGSMSFKLPTIDLSNTTIWFEMQVEDSRYTWPFQRSGFQITSSYVAVEDPNAPLRYQTVAPFNATTHAYLQIRENGGYFFYETSPDGKTWTTQRSVKNPYNPSSSFLFSLEINCQKTAATDFLFTDVAVNATPLIPTKITKSSSTLPNAMEWEPGTSKLQVVNDLLAAINYASAYYDENGYFVAEPYISPAQRGAEFTYATDEDSVITGDVNQTVDLFNVPNKWTLVVSDPDKAPLVGTYTNTDPMSPTSTVSRGRTIVDYRTEQDAADQITLDAKAARLAFEASQVYEKIEWVSGLMPIHSEADVYGLIIDGLVIDNKYSETAWSMTLEPGSTMKHECRRITNV